MQWIRRRDLSLVPKRPKKRPGEEGPHSISWPSSPDASSPLDAVPTSLAMQAEAVGEGRLFKAPSRYPRRMCWELYKRTFSPSGQHFNSCYCCENIFSTSATNSVTMMRIALVVLFVGAALAAPQGRPNPPFIEIVSSDSTGIAEDGSYSFSYEGSDGTVRQQSGRPIGPGVHQVQGTYSYTDPEGNRVEVRFVADDNGYVAESPFLPVAPPMPAHALEQIAFAEEQKRQGVQFDTQGFIVGRRN
ncbi:uncharacterized protein LOC143034253 [Oratosquilla oratoria]|uniref:uncharacterized protein LOC143034253 n=1 Tax=Oratosquilla oratoria TaxID=337810 RepID=UPI003F776572